MNPPSHTDPAASTTPSIEQQRMSEPPMSTNLNGLQAMLQLAAMMSQNPLGNINLSGVSPLGSSTTPQPQFQQPTSAPHVLQTQSAPNLLSLLGVQSNAFAAPALGTLIAAGTPVGSCENDEEVLLKALRESSGKAWTYRQALDSLHGVNNHTAQQWKDYYLDHTTRINRLVSYQNGERPIIAKKPMLDSKPKHNGMTSYNHQASSSKQPSPSVIIKKEKVETKRRVSDKGKGREVPSRTPSPPRNTVMRGKNHAFTAEDKEFLINYATYRLNEDPHLKKLDIAAELARKAPHHTANSWTSHWSNNREYYDLYIPQVIDARRGAEDSGSEVETDSSDDDSSSYSSGEDTDSEDDVQNMSAAGEMINDADRRVTARYIASVGAEWNHLRGRERWEPVENMYPQRNSKAWAEVYRNHSKVIDELVGKYRRRSQMRKSAVQSQKAVPSWAKNGRPSGMKRVRSDDDEPLSSRSKRSRDEGDSSS